MELESALATCAAQGVIHSSVTASNGRDSWGKVELIK